MNMDKILEEAIEKDASDVHLICGNKPMIRIARELTPVEGMDVLTPEDMNEMYDYFNRLADVDSSLPKKFCEKYGFSIVDTVITDNDIDWDESFCEDIGKDV